MSLEGKVALVTGASRGIGRAIALELAKAGATVIGTATTKGGAENISQYLSRADALGCGMVLNVTDAQQVDVVLKAIAESYAAPLILINNAGVTQDNIMMRMKTDEWDSVIDTNLNAVYRVVKPCLRAMTKARWGRIIISVRSLAQWVIQDRSTTPLA